MRLSWYVPITWPEYLALPMHVRMSMFLALGDVKRELQPDGGSEGAVTGQPRGDKKAGF